MERKENLQQTMRVPTLELPLGLFVSFSSCNNVISFVDAFTSRTLPNHDLIVPDINSDLILPTLKLERPISEVEIFDTTLRDGEQGARQTFFPDQKAAIAKQLEESVGVDVIDAGFPGSSEIDFKGAYRVAQETNKARLSVLSYGTPNEIRTAAKAVQPAEERSIISTFHRAMEQSSRYSSKGQIRKRLLHQARKSVEVASELAPEVQYYMTYCGDRDPDFLVELAHEVAAAGATKVVVADSQSSMSPGQMHDLTRRIVKTIEQYDTEVSAHCHNQLGLALPNTLAAISAGAKQIETTLLGIGDAGGNLALEQVLAYKERFCNLGQECNADAYTTKFTTKGDTSLVETVKLCRELSDMFRFNVGENQPIIGSRAFTCTTGIHQDNLDHLGHTAFDPDLAGREWTIAINRHSSRKTVQSALLKIGADKQDAGHNALVDGVYSWVKSQSREITETALRHHYEQYAKAYETLESGKTMIIPTTVGYTLASSRLGANDIRDVKGRPDGKPFGILGTPEIYEEIFGVKPPSKLPDSTCMGFLGRPSYNLKHDKRAKYHFLTEDCYGKDDKVGVWLNLGPIQKYLATRLWEERGEIIIASSCNKAGKGNPTGDHFSTSCLDPVVRSQVSFEVDIPHWQTPQFSEEGRWLSAPIFDMEDGRMIRVGRDMNVAMESIIDYSRKKMNALLPQ